MPDEAGQPSPAATPATPAAVLAAWLADLVAMVHEQIADLTAEELAFQPDPQGNSIGVTVWHFSRWLDVVGRAFAGQPASGELWHTGGWAARTGYDPTGIGDQGLGPQPLLPAQRGAPRQLRPRRRDRSPQSHARPPARLLIPARSQQASPGADPRNHHPDHARTSIRQY
jgi:hypothetical protein